MLTLTQMATYSQIKAWIWQAYARTTKDCWIADIKREFGLNRVQRTDAVLNPCPPFARARIIAAFEHFGMIAPKAA